MIIVSNLTEGTLPLLPIFLRVRRGAAQRASVRKLLNHKVSYCKLIKRQWGRDFFDPCLVEFFVLGVMLVKGEVRRFR